MQADKPQKIHISWEIIIYATIILVAMILRLYQLGTPPLQASESSLALSSWQLVKGQNPETWGEPLIVGSTSGIFFLFGDNDFTARLVPALLGTALVLLPWFLRGIIGKSGAVVAALLLASSPSFINFSRSLSEHIYVATLSLLLVVYLFRYGQGKHSILPIGAVAVLLLCSGAMGFNTIIIFAFCFALMFALDKGWAELEKLFQAAWGRRQTLTGYTLLAMALFLSVSTGSFTYFQGLGLPSLTAWIKAFDLPGGGGPWYWHLQLMAAYDTLIMVLGLLGAGYVIFRWGQDGVRETTSSRIFLVFWAGGSLILLALMGKKEAGQILSPLLPLALLAGSLIGEQTKKLSSRSLSQVGISAALLFLLLGIIIFPIHTSWSLNYKTNATEWLTPCATSPDVLEMTRAVEDLSKNLLTSEAKVAIDSSIRQPFAWYLRHRENVDYVDKLTAEAPMIIARPEKQTNKELSGYTMRLRGNLCTEWARDPFNFSDFWHWFIYHEGWGDQRQTSVALYLRR